MPCPEVQEQNTLVNTRKGQGSSPIAQIEECMNIDHDNLKSPVHIYIDSR